MPKKKASPPAPSGVVLRTARHCMGVFKRNPWTSGAAIVTMAVGISSLGVAGYLSTTIEPIWYVSHAYLREWGEPIIKIQNTQAVGFDRFLLYQQQDALAKAKNDPAAKTSPIVQERIQTLENQAHDTQIRICKATGKSCQ